MKKSELNRFIKEEIKSVQFDIMLNNYKDLYENHPNEWFGIGWGLLHEYRIDLSNTYDSTIIEDDSVYGYEFKDSIGVRHLTTVQKRVNEIKIGPSLGISNRIDTKKRSAKYDDKLLSTHVNNIFKILKDRNLKTVHFSAADDEYKNVRERLFTNLINRLKDDISDIKKDVGGTITLTFK